MTFDQLLAAWKKLPAPTAIIVKGKGCTWTQANEWRMEHERALVFCLNNDNNPIEATPDLHFDIHAPRHHMGVEGVPTMVHWSMGDKRPGTVPFPIDRMPRRKFGCTTAYMLGLAWLLLDMWPRARIMAPGCNYNSTPGERDRERESINYWAGRIEAKTGRRIETQVGSRAIDRDSANYHAGRAEQFSGCVTTLADEDYR